MYAGYLSILRTNDFRCVFRYYYGVNANTGKEIIFLIDSAPYSSLSTLIMYNVGEEFPPLKFSS